MPCGIEPLTAVDHRGGITKYLRMEENRPPLLIFPELMKKHWAGATNRILLCPNLIKSLPFSAADAIGFLRF